MVNNAALFLLIFAAKPLALDPKISEAKYTKNIR